MNKIMIILILGYFFSTQVLAETSVGFSPKFYLGVDSGVTSFKGGSPISPETIRVQGGGRTALNSYSENGTTPGFFVGVELNKNFGLELGYLNLGNINYDYLESRAFGSRYTTTSKSKAFNLLVVGKFNLNSKFNLLGKVGFQRWSNKGTSSIEYNEFSGRTIRANQFDNSGTDPLISLGASYQLSGRYSLVFDVSQSKLAGIDTRSASLGVKFNLGQ